MKKVFQLAYKLGFVPPPPFLSFDFVQLHLIQLWLTEKHELLVYIEPAVKGVGSIYYRYVFVDARTGFYNVKAESNYDFNTYSLALEAGIWSALTYLQ